MNPSATQRGGMLFGRLVEQSPLTGCEPKTCINVSSEHTQGTTKLGPARFRLVHLLCPFGKAFYGDL